MGRQKACKESRYDKKTEGKHTKLHPYYFLHYSCHVSAIQRYFGHMTTVEVCAVSLPGHATRRTRTLIQNLQDGIAQ